MMNNTRRYDLTELIKEDIRKKKYTSTSNTTSNIISDIKKKYRERLDETKLNLNTLRQEYTIFINDSSVLNPFVIDSDILKIVKHETKDCYGQEETAMNLFNWFEDNINYGKKKRKYGYSTGREVFENKEGICGEMAFLYVTMARGISLESGVVDVLKDYEGKKVAHACAGVNVERGYILVDPAYHTFDIKHKKYKPMNDKEIMDLFEHWRKN